MKRRTQKYSGCAQSSEAADMDCIRNLCVVWQIFLNSFIPNLDKIVVSFKWLKWNCVWYLCSALWPTCLCHIPYPGHAHSWHHAYCQSFRPWFKVLLKSVSEIPICHCLSCKSKSELPITRTCMSKQMKVSHCPRTFFEDVFEHKTHAVAGRK